MNYTLIKDITPGIHTWRIRVRLIRFSTFPVIGVPATEQPLDIIMVDEQGTPMHAIVPYECRRDLGATLAENHVCYVYRFQVADPKPTYRPVATPLMAKFTRFTQVIPITPEPRDFPHHAWTLCPFDQLSTRKDDFIFLADIVGMISFIRPARIADARGAPTDVRDTEITDGRDTFQFTLWGAAATEFSEIVLPVLQRNERTPIVAVGLVVKEHSARSRRPSCSQVRQDVYLQSSSFTKLYVDPPIPDRAALIQRCPSMPQQLVPVDQPTTEQEYLPRSMAELAALDPHENMGNRYEVTATIQESVPGQSWWYMSCSRCHKTVKKQGSSYRCFECTQITPVPRYKVALIYTGDADPPHADPPLAEFTFFAQTAENLIGCSVDAVLASGQHDQCQPPPQIMALYGKQLKLKVMITAYAFSRPIMAFQVIRAEKLADERPNTPPYGAVTPEEQAHFDVSQPSAGTPAARTHTSSVSDKPDEISISPGVIPPDTQSSPSTPVAKSKGMASSSNAPQQSRAAPTAPVSKRSFVRHVARPSGSAAVATPPTEQEAPHMRLDDQPNHSKQNTPSSTKDDTTTSGASLPVKRKLYD